jgi:predicted metalloprotease with PDZ domain
MLQHIRLILLFYLLFLKLISVEDSFSDIGNAQDNLPRLEISQGSDLKSTLKAIDLVAHNKLYTNMNSVIKLQKDLDNIILIQNYLFDFISAPYDIFLIHNDGKSKIEGVATKNYILIEGNLKADYQESIRIVSHELAHRYIGHILKQSDDTEVKYKWFFEGFTEFYGVKTLLEANIISEEQYIKIVNNTLADYFNSLVIDIDFNKITKNHLVDSSIRMLSYNKGFVVALVTNHVLRKHSNDKYCLDNLMRQMIIGANEKNFDLTLYARILKNYLPQNLVDSILLSAHDPNLLKSILPERIKNKSLKVMPVASYAMCFNLTKSLESQLIYDVHSNSECYAQGLRAGQQLNCYSIDYGTGNVRLKVTENQEQKIIEFNLKKIKRFIPVFN